MQDQKALLDSLMGNDRHVSKKDQNAKRQSFQDDEICKHFLAWDCPHDFFLNEEGKPVPRSPLGVCPKQHSEAMKLRFTKDKDYDKYRYRYLQKLEEKMRKLISGVNAKRDMERDKLQKGEAHSQIVVKTHIEARSRLVKDKLEEADKLGASGEHEASQNILDEATEKQGKLARLKEMNEDRLDEICDVCGIAISWGDPGMKGFGTAHGHFLGALHMGWVQMREALVKIQDFLKDAPEPDSKFTGEQKAEDRVQSRTSEKEINRDAGTERRGDRERDGDRRNRETERCERGRETGRDHKEHRDRSRERTARGSTRDKEETRDRRHDREERNRKRDDVDEFGRGAKRVDYDEFGRARDYRGKDTRRDKDDTKRADDRSRSKDRKVTAGGVSQKEEVGSNEPEAPEELRIFTEDTETVKTIYVEYSDDWQDVMNAKFGGMKLEKNGWDMTSFDSKGKPLETNICMESFPLQFKFTKK